MRSMGLDIGGRRIGVAVSDARGTLAFPLETLQDLDPAGVREYVRGKLADGVGLVVVGLPLTTRGCEGRQAEATREYVRALEDLEGLKVVLWDERFSTVEARKRLREAGRHRRGRKADAAAAAVILQSYLDSMRSRGR